MEKALVTGGAGFIGSHLVRELLKRRVSVRVLDNLVTGRIANLEGVANKIEFMDGDIRNAIACRNACRGIDTVFHLAAFVSVPQSIVDPIQSDAVNIGGTLNLLLASRDYRVKRFVFSSSAAVYGEADRLPIPETALPAPASPFGVQKLTAEHYACNFTRLYGLETVSLRYFNVYGPRQNHDATYAAVVPKFLTCLLAGASPTVYGDGEQTRDFCCVRDVVAANLLAAESGHPGVPGGVFNIASGTRTSLNELLRTIVEVSGCDLPARIEAARPRDILHSAADIRRAKKILGFKPKVTLTAGLKEALDYYRTCR